MKTSSGVVMYPNERNSKLDVFDIYLCSTCVLLANFVSLSEPLVVKVFTRSSNTKNDND